jgi:hypothetical protein
MDGRLVVALALMSACSNTPGKVEPAAAGEAEDTAKHRDPTGPLVRGRIAAIRLHNINKALGHYTYNVELEVEHTAIEGPLEIDAAVISPVLTVRVDKIYFDQLGVERQRALAPDGPKAELRPPSFGDYAVGQDVVLPVSFTSPTLAHLRS